MKSVIVIELILSNRKTVRETGGCTNDKQKDRRNVSKGEEETEGQRGRGKGIDK